jgi:outer membrane protein OmpA-like peptidoglycan-associated protein
MQSVKLSRWAFGVALIALVLASTGCCEKEKKMIQSLRGENDLLRNELEDYQSQLAASRDNVGQLNDQLRVKDMTIDDLRRQLEKQPAPQPAPTGGQDWERGLHGDRLTIESDILFPSGKADLTPQGKQKLNQVVNDLKTQYANQPVRVYGYTDTDPIMKTKNLWQDNLDLSANRAMSVTRYLWEKGISPKNIETIAMGEFFPEQSKPQSRRVEIVVIKD